MDKVCCKLTVFFDNPFWIGVFESKVNPKRMQRKIENQTFVNWKGATLWKN